ncbi:tRNA 5-methoxyuridine(34)/uridine 5-oxyacetic acid(34) synthase CmoB [Alteromonas sp. SM 2104]|nr:tRNA 5-methoxyuridine(34)/uridine 5-oxyacetic acid(34) synthase CmoB [Alteromonas oceanisediminis]MBT0587141.1 tRNA 5-methoxyuridine(34)/uridine 5-oxyacetic acid(34) synthase CmoB [Alteromonas oceanisediminis]
MNHWFNECYKSLIDASLDHWLDSLPNQLHHWQAHVVSKEVVKLCHLIDQLPHYPDAQLDLKDAVSVTPREPMSEKDTARITALLQHFMPWRKGPFTVGDVHIDTEWRSDWKWERVLPHIAPLAGKRVLDVGCGSGYHLWRMAGEDAELVIGIDPTALFFAQFHAIKHFIRRSNVHMLPLGIEEMPALKSFHSVFSMGVLYHRRDPIQFLTELKNQLLPGGQLILETLVIDGDENTVFMPQDRYAQMRNVWFLPSTKALSLWLARCGFVDIQVVDESVTSLEEQRKTAWMDNLSLADFLDPSDKQKTIEGYPAPKRAVLLARTKLAQ